MDFRKGIVKRELTKSETEHFTDWAQLFKVWGLYRIDLEEMQIPFRLNSDLDLKCYSHGYQLIHQPNSLHY